MTTEELRKVLDLHKQWLDTDGKEGQRADFRGANLRKVDFREADLRGANFWGADLWGADLWGADFRGADFREADLRGANFRGADLWGANLQGATLPDFQIVPKEGSFVGYKKTEEGVVLKLEIPETAQRTSSLIGRKCRASEVVVLEALESTEKVFHSQFDGTFKYVVGEKVSVLNFDEDIRVECAKGIHFFITEGEAVNY